ncbi:DNA cross-link repair 1A protein isoform X1 [Thalassophryne amazonica]|uniref:DNA cross-link repair 1A protein isoform X1 n=1 Tax=Thalassophryne amazonica TaxID=390379 RepID=UPI00147157A8|nr:DNA cross-link repair 1A protein isoform X1 [Thalassophryne amazonica]
MRQEEKDEDGENDIWEYKPLEKTKKRRQSPNGAGNVQKRRCAVRKTRQTKSDTPNKTDSHVNSCTGQSLTENSSSSSSERQLSKSADDKPTKEDQTAEGLSSGDEFCPVCQMPFSILLMQCPRWHVAECLDTPRDKCKECPDGLKCSSTIPGHYKKYSHTLLAHSRAGSDHLSLSQQAGPSGINSLSHVSGQNTELDSSTLETSQESAASFSDLSSGSSIQADTPPSKCTNSLLLLRSPCPEDLKKKKGWLPSKGQRSIRASQDNTAELSSATVKVDNRLQACESLVRREVSSDSNDGRYSPLSEFPAQIDVNSCGTKRTLFSNDASENEGEASMVLFSDGFSSEDELYAKFTDDPEADDVPAPTQLELVTSLAPTNQLAAVAGNMSESTGEEEEEANAESTVGTNFQFPQSVVLDRLREMIRNSENSHFGNVNDSTVSQQVPSQASSVPTSQTMAPRKRQGKSGQTSSLKQMDIGVFFGVKLLKEKQAESGPQEVNAPSSSTLGESSGQRQGRQRRNWQRGSKTDTTAETSEGAVGVRGGTWRRRWNRGRTDGQTPRCPFYKKIPGTKFVIDAFCYGEIEGITAYFLTHFHSDHYDGLNKNSTLPIYCNKITGNLVKSKLKVAEQYVHILPMNTQVTVEGVKVTLLDANHCPGAAMLLLVLSDGQTVLHTGDFRADPSMETYPELLSCRVQTLYLDTTYCSPEYTFPKQQEVINFAANTAFELVTLNPRTLVVCGSYSVGKEKVFLALADVLGSKVSLSRDKYSTMCCLELEQVRQRMTTDWKAAQVHVLPMMQISFKKLQDHLARFSAQYDELVAFKPTGWTFSQQVESVEDIRPQISGNISIYGIPYSEHSSFLEMKHFVQWLQPLKIIPTVNGSWENRKAMAQYFSEWLAEIRAMR